jgi:AAA domain
MIIELFGPPGAGKTTFARNLATRLRATGQPVELIMSLRPVETIGAAGDARSASPPWPVIRRLARPAVEFLAGMRPVCEGSPKTSIVSELFHFLPPRSFVWSVRMRQYLLRLEHSWRAAERSYATVIVDQGFVQAICSLVLLCRAPTATGIEKALALIPKADQWLHLDAPWEVLRARLEARRRSLSWIERRFELDLEGSFRSIEILNMLDSILRLREPRIAEVVPGDGWLPRDLSVMAIGGAL